MARAIRRVAKREMSRNYSSEPMPVDEFEAEPKTVPDAPVTMAALVAQAVRP